MRILRVENSRKPNGVEITGLAAKDEYKQLAGCLANIKLFAAETITEPASHTKTGLRHQYAKYPLLPVRLRRRYRTNTYDFDQLKCGVLTNDERLYIIYTVPTKGLTPEQKNGRWHVKPAGTRGSLHLGGKPSIAKGVELRAWLRRAARLLADHRWPLDAPRLIPQDDDPT